MRIGVCARPQLRDGCSASASGGSVLVQGSQLSRRSVEAMVACSLPTDGLERKVSHGGAIPMLSLQGMCWEGGAGREKGNTHNNLEFFDLLATLQEF